MGFDVFFERSFAIEAEHRRKRLRHARGGNDCARLLGNLDTGLSGHDDILVVGQNDDRVGVDLVDGSKDVGRGRVHGLTAGNNDIDTEGFENLGRARAGSHSNDAKRLVLCLELRLDFLIALVALQLHVVDMYFRDLAIVRKEPAQNLIGAVGVHVHLEVGVHADHKVAVSHGRQEVFRSINVNRVGMHEESVQ